MFSKFTQRAQKVLQISQNEAIQMNHSTIGSEHILLGLIRETDGLALKALQELGVSLKEIEESVQKLSEYGEGKADSYASYGQQAKRIIELSIDESRKLEHSHIGTEHLLLALARGESLAARALSSVGVSLNRVRQKVLEASNGTDIASSKSTSRTTVKTPTLDELARDLTKVAKEKKLDPVIGRDSEVTRMVEVLSRRKKSNPVLIGEPGVGKTAIIEGLAQRIVSRETPSTLFDKRIMVLDMGVAVAGTKYRGEFEDRMKKMMREVEEAGNIVLFIDEMHTLIGAGGAEGAMDASNILKPALARGGVQCIGATTIDEYRKYIEKDAALERRFQPIQVDEPTVEETSMILQGLRSRYEEHHQLKITDEAIEAASRMSDRYISDRFLPDKAIDLIDEAGSKVRLRSYTKPIHIKELEETMKAHCIGKELAINNRDFDSAAEHRVSEQRIKEELLKEKKSQDKNTVELQVTVNDIAEVVAMWTGIPVSKIAESESIKLLNMEEALHSQVIGQSEAVTAVSKAIRRARVGISSPNRPIGSFIFMGQSGTGKSHLAKTLAETMFGDEEAMIRVDMSEYMEKHSTSRLVGSPPGYVGHEEGGQLTEQVRRKPYSVILLDEIEKAHPDVFNMLLQVLDDGRLTDSQGRTVDFRNTVIIMTSNIGAQVIKEVKYVGFGTQSTNNKVENEKSTMLEELKKAFRPEFLNRVDETIVFHPLKKEHLRKIVTLMTNDLVLRLKEQDINLELTDAAKLKVAEIGYDPQYGARPLRRAIQKHIEDRLSEEALKGVLSTSNKVVVGIKNGEFDVRIETEKKNVLELTQ